MRYFYRMSTGNAMKVSHATLPGRPYNRCMRTNGILSALAVLATWTFCSNANAQELWNGIQIGESEAAILHRYPGATRSVDREIPGAQPRRENLTVDDFGSGPCRLRVRFVFPLGGRLDAVHVTTGENMLTQPAGIRAICAQQILDGLNEKYGPPDSAGAQDDTDTEIAVWHRPGGVNIEYVSQKLLGAFVSYSLHQPMAVNRNKDQKSAL